MKYEMIIDYYYIKLYFHINYHIIINPGQIKHQILFKLNIIHPIYFNFNYTANLQ